MPPIPQPKPSEQLAVIAANVQMLHQGMEDIRSTQERMADAIGKLAVIEERQSTTADAVSRSFVAISDIETRVRVLETHSVLNNKASSWVEKAVLGIVVLAAMFIAKKTGLG